MSNHTPSSADVRRKPSPVVSTMMGEFDPPQQSQLAGHSSIGLGPFAPPVQPPPWPAGQQQLEQSGHDCAAASVTAANDAKSTQAKTRYLSILLSPPY